jgi:Ni/Co efflux regulator RcnB
VDRSKGAALIATLLLATSIAAGIASPNDASRDQRQSQLETQNATSSRATVRTYGDVSANPFPGHPTYQAGRKPHNWQKRPSLTEFERQHHTYFSERRHRWQPYVRPPGWYYRRWLFGDTLPRAFWTAEYRIFDYWIFGLPIPPIDCEWVRYDHDILLVDIRTGEVVEVVYDYF